MTTLAATRPIPNAKPDAAAQARLVRTHQDDWYRFCLALLRDPHAAEDATQETALRVLRDLQRFSGGSTFRTWSLGIALNVCREMRRRAARSRTLPIDAAAQQATTPTTNEDEQWLLAMLDNLTDRQREVVVLRYFEQLSIAETAARMDCAGGTVKATLSQALRKLRDLWRNES